MQDVPTGFGSRRVDCGAVTLHVVTNARGGDPAGDDRPAILFLHGFPEYWAGWKPVFPFLADDFLLIAPDQRGYNLSDAPQAMEAYAARALVADMMTLARQLLGPRKFLLAGHDWGASIAYALAIGAPDRLAGLVIINGVHPVPFQRALLNDPEQIAASQYFHRLRAPGATERMSENGFARTLSMFEKFSSTPWLTAAERRDYVAAWSRPGRMNAMLNWYRASPIVVPLPDAPAPEAPLADGDPEKLRVRVPHLLVWGQRDQALRPSSHAGLEAFAPALRIVGISDGDHWVIHTHGERIAAEIRRFAGSIGMRG